MKFMKKKKSLIKKILTGHFRLGNEKGSMAILIAVMILVVVSLIGIQSSNTSTLEVQIASAERTARENFYKAEGAAMRGAQEIENAEPEVLVDRSEVWINEKNDVDFLDVSQWDYDGLGSDDNAENGPFDDSFFGAIDEGVAKGSSLDPNASQKHKFRVYGRCISENESAFIEVGYIRKF